jgi:hypothetical protein
MVEDALRTDGEQGGGRSPFRSIRHDQPASHARRIMQRDRQPSDGGQHGPLGVRSGVVDHLPLHDGRLGTAALEPSFAP